MTLEKNDITVLVPDEMKLKAVLDTLQSKLHRRGVLLKALTYGKVEQASGGALRQKIALQRGIPIEKTPEIVKLIKETKLRVRAAIQENQVRVSGKSRDDLQAVIAMLRDRDLGITLQFVNYRSTSSVPSPVSSPRRERLGWGMGPGQYHPCGTLIFQLDRFARKGTGG